MSGKPGRPRADAMERRREIWTRVSPLIVERGVHKLTMRRAAAAAYMSVGGLCHYFPTKHSLVLYGLDQEALVNACVEFKSRKYRDQDDAREALVQSFGTMYSLVRPAVLAALELGPQEFTSQLEATVQTGLDEFTKTLRLAIPDADDRDIGMVARTVRRMAFTSLLDRSMTREKIEDELRAVIGGTAARPTAPLVTS